MTPLRHFPKGNLPKAARGVGPVAPDGEVAGGGAPHGGGYYLLDVLPEEVFGD